MALWELSVGSICTHPLRLAVSLKCFSHLERRGADWLFQVPAAELTNGMKSQRDDEVRHAELLSALSDELRAELPQDSKVAFAKVFPGAVEETKQYLVSVRRAVDVKWLELRRRGLAAFTADPNGFARSRFAVRALILERRAAQVYALMSQASTERRVRALTRRLVSEEKEHLSLVQSQIRAFLRDRRVDLNELLAQEEALASECLSSLARRELA